MSNHAILARLAMIALLLVGAAFAPLATRADSATPRSASDSQIQVSGMTQGIADSLDAKADYYWHMGDYPRIIAVDRVVVEADPHNVDAYSNAGWLMESNGDDQSAEAFYEQGCSMNPGTSFMAYQLAFFYYNTMHQYDKAAAVLSKSVTYPDAGVNDWKLLAHSYTRGKEYSQALATWQTIKARYPNAAMVDHNLQEVEALVQKQSAN